MSNVNFQSVGSTIAQARVMKSLIADLSPTEVVCLYSIYTAMNFTVDSPVLLMNLGLSIIGQFVRTLNFDIKNQSEHKFENKKSKRYSNAAAEQI